ncbi:MAG: hypothetical protein AAF636_21270 [Pseudomonadota bacterium]
MTYKFLSLSELQINASNDRHGELENETAAIGWLFSNHATHMKNLTKDLVTSGEVFEPPLVYRDNGKYVVYDGNRRTTCLKLLASPKKAPDAALQKFYADQRALWSGKFPAKIRCRIETDRDYIDDILFRRHTGSQSGVGQSNWTGRMATTFVNRTGKGGKLNVADEVEKLLEADEMLPASGEIPRSNLNRLLSSEAFRNRVGISATKGELKFIRKKEPALNALSRVASDLASKTITLDDVWDTERKTAYLDRLENEGVLPTASDAIDPTSSKSATGKKSKKPTKKAKKSKRMHLIPDTDFGIAWTGSQQRCRAIWEELQFDLELEHHPHAIAVLCRVLLELSVDNYIKKTSLAGTSESDSLLNKMTKSAEDLHAKSKIDKRYLQVVRKARNMDAIVSVDTLNKYVHSSGLAPTSDHLTSIWDTLSELVVHCLNE